MNGLKLRWATTYHGPNPCAPSGVVVGELTAERPPQAGQLPAAVAGLWADAGMEPLAGDEHSPADSDADPLLAMCEAVTAWARAVLNEVRGNILHAGAARDGQAVRMWVGFHDPSLSRVAVQLGLEVLAHRLGGQSNPSGLRAQLDRFWRVCRARHPDFQARILQVAARDMDVPCLPFLPDTPYWQFGWGARSRVFLETSSNRDGALGWRWQGNKAASKDLMRTLGLPTPAHVLVQQEAELGEAVKHIGFPCVVKPLDGGGGAGVTANITDAAGALQAFRQARQFSDKPLMVEQHVAGTDYRLMLVNGELVAAIERTASWLVGDGARTVRELLDQLNAPRSGNLVRSRYLSPIPADAVLAQHLEGQGVDLDSVLPAGRTVTLRSNANRSTGGTCRDVTDRLHPEVRAMAEQLARATGLAATGLDYLTRDIAQPPWESGGTFIEINATPGMAVFIAAGWEERTIGRVLLGTGLGRIPVELTVVSPDSLDAQLRSLQHTPLRDDEGLACGPALRVGAARLRVAPDRPWAAVHAALRLPHLQALRVLCTRQEIEQHGLPIDRFTRVDIRDPEVDPAWRRVLLAAQHEIPVAS